jgi:hypothetical protein
MEKAMGKFVMQEYHFNSTCIITKHGAEIYKNQFFSLGTTQAMCRRVQRGRRDKRKINEFSIPIISDNIGNKFDCYFKYLERDAKNLKHR